MLFKYEHFQISTERLAMEGNTILLNRQHLPTSQLHSLRQRSGPNWHSWIKLWSFSRPPLKAQQGELYHKKSLRSRQFQCKAGTSKSEFSWWCSRFGSWWCHNPNIQEWEAFDLGLHMSWYPCSYLCQHLQMVMQKSRQGSKGSWKGQSWQIQAYVKWIPYSAYMRRVPRCVRSSWLQIYQRFRKNDLWKNNGKKVNLFYNAEHQYGGSKE